MLHELRSAQGRFGVRDLFAPIDGETYDGEAEFQHAVIACFNANLHCFPPHYGYREAIQWAMRQRWLSVDGARITVSLPAEAKASPLAMAA
jgi:hypothetical protein